MSSVMNGNEIERIRTDDLEFCPYSGHTSELLAHFKTIFLQRLGGDEGLGKHLNNTVLNLVL